MTLPEKYCFVVERMLHLLEFVVDLSVRLLRQLLLQNVAFLFCEDVERDRRAEIVIGLLLSKRAKRSEERREVLKHHLLEAENASPYKHIQDSAFLL